MKKRVVAFAVLLVGVLLIAAQCPFPDPDPPPPGPDPDPTPGETLFFDDFEGGTDPAWQFVTGDWEAQGGWLHLAQNYGGDDVFGYVQGGENWSDYRVEADVKFGEDTYYRYQGFVLRAQDDLNKVVAWASATDFFFTVFADGVEVISQGSEVEPGWPEDTVVNAAVEAQGNTYRFYVNGVLRSVFTDGTFSNGKPGVAFRRARGGDHEGYRFDNFRVTALD